MTVTARLDLPLIDAAQAQKHVTHNEAIAALDQLVQASVLARTRTSPPATPAEGDAYLVAAAGSGAWTSQTNALAAWYNGVWNFFVPQTGWLVWCVAEARVLVWTGTLWADAFGLLAQNVPLFGLGTTADATNPLSAKLNRMLFTARAAAEGGSGDLRCALNKAAVANTVSQLYQTNFSGRAETGLTGDDRFHVKVSADGTTWREALVIDPATGGSTMLSLALQSALSIGGGGTGATTAAGARTALGLDACSFRNRLRNPGFAINQRAVAGTVTLAAGVYGHDGCKAGASGCTYTFSASGIDTAISVTAGSLILPIEAGSIEGGAYALSHAGTASARIWQGTGASGTGTYVAATGASPLLVVGLSTNTQTNVEFGSGTILRPQLEPGSQATAFERRPTSVDLAMCQRFTAIASASAQMPIAGAVIQSFSLPAQMRATPTITSRATDYGAAYTVNQATMIDSRNGFVQVSFGSSGGYMINYSILASAEI